MSVAPAEPLGDIAAELTLVFNKICSVFWTCLITPTNCNRSTLSTHKLFLLEVFIIIYLITSLHSSEIGLLAFEAHIIRKLAQCIILKLVVVPIGWILKPWIFMEIFKFGSFHSLFNNDLFELLLLFDFLVNGWALFGAHSLFAIWTVNIIKHNSGSIVLLLNKFFQTTNMEDVLASKHHTWLLPNT